MTLEFHPKAQPAPVPLPPRNAFEEGITHYARLALTIAGMLSLAVTALVIGLIYFIAHIPVSVLFGVWWIGIALSFLAGGGRGSYLDVQIPRQTPD